MPLHDSFRKAFFKPEKMGTANADSPSHSSEMIDECLNLGMLGMGLLTRMFNGNLSQWDH